jgi:hypothetical protein
MTITPVFKVPDRPSGLQISTADGKDQWWEGQQEAIGLIANALTRKKFVLANMPTGAGKTLVATAVQHLLDLPSLVVTHSIMLQEQYQKTLAGAITATGRSNHKCELPSYAMVPDFSAKEAPCATMKADCIHMKPDGCSYYRMLHGVSSSGQVIANYAYAVRVVQPKRLKLFAGGTVGNPFRRSLLVCDEAHLAHDAIVGAVKVSFQRNQWKDCPAKPPWQSADIEDWREWTKEAGPWLRQQVADTMEHIQSSDSASAAKTLARLQSREEALSGLNAFKDSGCVFQSDERGITIQPVWGKEIAGNFFRYFPRVLMMSATIGDPELFAWKLGIDMDEVTHFDIPSTFPKERRPVYFWPVAKLNRHSGDEEWEAVARAVEKIASDPALKDKKGLIHSGSYRNAKRLGALLDRERFLVQYQGGRGILEAFRKSSKPLVLISPSVGLGFDYPYAIGWQAIVKVPFGDLGDPVTKARLDFKQGGDPIGRRDYDGEVMNRIIQASGRVMRAPDDSGVTFILDANYAMVHAKTPKPQFYTEAYRRMS